MPDLWRTNNFLIMEEISEDDLELASEMLDKLEAGTFYKEQEEAAKEIGLTIKYI